MPPPLSVLPGEDVDEGRPKERDTEEEGERGKKESSRLGEGRLFLLNIAEGSVKKYYPRYCGRDSVSHGWKRMDRESGLSVS